MSLDDFLSQGEARLLWSRFESLVGQQVFRLRVEGDTANVPSSLCSLLSCDLSSPERIAQFEPACIQSGHLQRNTNALEIDKQPLYGLPYIAQSTCPLLSLILINIQELRSLDRFLDPCEALRRLRDIKRSLLDVHKKALLLESQLHQYINPTLVTTLNRRSAKATFEAELMCKLIDKLRKDSRQSASEPEKRKRVCELTMKLKALLCRQKCEWQCVGRLKETLAIARDMKGVLKFICQLSCLLEHCSDASRRLPERPPPYEYCSPYDSGSKQDSSDALYEDLKLIDNQCPPYQSQSSHSQVTISLSLDFTSDREFEGRSNSSDDSTYTRTSSYRHRSRSHSKDHTDVKSDSDAASLSSRKRSRVSSNVKKDLDAATLSSRRHSRAHNDVKSGSDPASLSSRRRSRDYSVVRGDSEATTRRHRKSKHESLPPAAKSSLNHIRRAKSASSFSSRTSSRRSRKHSTDSEGRVSTSSRSHQQTVLVPPVTEASAAVHDTPKTSYSRTTRSVSPIKSVTPRERLLSKKLAEETINELIGVLEEFIENKSESMQRSESRNSMQRSESRNSMQRSESRNSMQRSESRNSPMQSSYKSGEASRSEPTSRQTFNVYSSLLSESPSSRQWSRTSPKLPNHLSSASFSPTARERSLVSEAQNDLQDSHTFSRQSFTKDVSSVHSAGWSSGSPKKSEFRHSLLDNRLSQQTFDGGRMTRQDLDEPRIVHNDLEVSKQSLNEVKISRNSLNETRMSRPNVSDARLSSPDFKSTMSKQIDFAMSTNLQNVSQEEVKSVRNSFNEPRPTRQNFGDARMSSPDFKSSMSKNLQKISQDFSQTRINQGELYSTRLSRQNETRISRQNVEEARINQEQLAQARTSQYENLKMKTSQEDLGESYQTRGSQRDIKPSRSGRQNSEGKRKSMEDISDKASKRTDDQSKIIENYITDSRQCKRFCDQLRLSRKSLKENELSRKSLNENELGGKYIAMDEHNLEKIRSETRSSMAEISRVQIERQRQLARECADVVRRRIASISPPPSGSRHTQSKQMCASTSPPRVRRDVDKICSRYETNSLAKNTSELSDHVIKKPSKIINSPLSVISESKDYQSSNTEIQELEPDAETNNMEDVSTNRNASDPKKSNSCNCSPRQIRMSVSPDRCRHRKATPPLTQRMPDDCKFYMQPRCDNSDSSGSRDPLLFSSQETNLSCDDDDDGSELSYKSPNVIKKPRTKVSRHQRTRSRKCFDGNESDLLEDTTTTTDSCAYDEDSTSVSPHRSYSGQQRQASRTQHMDDTEGDIDQESDFEEELELKDTPEQFMDKDIEHPAEQSLRWDRKSTVYPFKSESYHSRRSASKSSHQTPVINGSTSRRDRRFLSSWQGSGQTGGQTGRQSSRQSSPKSFYKSSEDRTASLKQSMNEQYLQQPYLSPSTGQLSAREDLTQADVSHSLLRQSPYYEADLRGSDLVYGKSPVLSEQLGKTASYTHSQTGSRRFPGEPASLHSSYGREASQFALEPSQMSIHSYTRPVQSQQQSEYPASSYTSMSHQKFASAASQTSAKVSSIFSQPQSPRAFTQSSQQGIPTASSRRASTVRWSSTRQPQHSRPPSSVPSTASTHPAASVRGYPSVVSVQPHVLPSTHGIPEYCQSRLGSPTAIYPTGSMHRYPSAEHPQMPPLIPGISEHSRPAELPAPFYPAGSVHGYPSSVSEQTQVPSLTPGIPSHGPSIVGTSAPMYSAASLHGYPSVSEQTQVPSLTPGIPSHGPSIVGTSAPMYSAASLHGYPSVASERSQILPSASRVSPHYASQVGSYAAVYPAGFVHGYPSSVSEQTQVPSLTPGITSHGPSSVGISAPMYAAGSLHGYPSVVSEHPQILPSASRVSPHFASHVGSYAPMYPAGSVHGYPSAVSEETQVPSLGISSHGPSQIGASASSHAAGSVHGYPSSVSEQTRVPSPTSYGPSRDGTSASTYPAASAHGYSSAVSEQPQMLPSASRISPPGAYQVVSSAAMYPAASVHGYPSAVSEQTPQVPGILSHGPSRKGTPASKYPAGSVHGYPPAVSEQPPQATGILSHGPSRAGTPASTYAAASVHGYPAVSEQPPQAPGILSHGPSRAGTPASTYAAASVHGYPSAVSEQPPQAPGMLSHDPSKDGTPASGILSHGPSKDGTPASTYAAGSVHGYPSAVSEQPPQATGILSHGPSRAGTPASTYAAASVHGYPSAVSEQPPQATGILSHSPSRAGTPASTYAAASVHGYPAVSEQLPQAPGILSHGPSKDGTPASTYAAASVHGYPSAVSEQPPQATGILSHGPSRAGTPASTYAAASVHGYPAVSEQLPQAPGILSHGPSKDGTPASTYAAASVHGYPSAVSEQPPQAPGILSHGPSRAGSPASTYAAASVHGYPSAISEQPPQATGISSHGPSKDGTPASTYAAASVHGYPSAVSEQPPQAPGILSHGPSRAGTPASTYAAASVHGYPSAVSEQPPQAPGILSHGPSKDGTPASTYAAASVHGYPSAVSEQPPQDPGILSHGPSKDGTPASTYTAASVHGYPSAISEQLPQDPGILSHGPSRAGSPASTYAAASVHGYPSAVSEQPPPAPGILSRGPSRAGTPAPSYQASSVHGYAFAVSEQPQVPLRSPGASQLTAMRAPTPDASYAADSSAALGQQQILPQTPRASQQSRVQVLSYSAMSPSVHPEFSDELHPDVERNSQALSLLSDAQSGLQHMDSEIRQPRQSTISDMSRHSAYQAVTPESPRRTSFQTDMSGTSVHSPSQADFTAASRSLAHSEYSYTSRRSPSKSLRVSATQKSLTPEEAEMATSYIHGDMSRSSARGSLPRSSLPQMQTSSRDVPQERYDYEDPDSQMVGLVSTPSSTSRDQSEAESRETWWVFVPLVILALILLYYIICYLASTGGCVSCRAPLPNIFFYLINSAVHSVRLIHSAPAPV